MVPERTDLTASLRTAGVAGVVAGAVGSLGLMLRAGRQTPRFLLVIFVFWVLSPFVLLVLADRFSTRWSGVTRATLYSVMLLVAVGSVAVYGADAVWPRRSQAAFVYVIVPPISWLVTAVVIAAAALMSRESSR